MRDKFICTQPHSGSRPPFCRWAKLDEKDWIDGEIPIEDCGMFLILDEEISQNSASRLFIALLAKQEGEIPEVVDDDKVEEVERSRSPWGNCVLSDSEFKIYLKLIENK